MSIDSPDFAREDGLTPVDKNATGPSLEEANEIFLRHGDRLVLYSDNRRNRQMTAQRLNDLVHAQRREVVINKSHPADMLNLLADNLANKLSDPRIGRGEKMLTLYSSTADAVAHLCGAKVEDAAISRDEKILAIYSSTADAVARLCDSKLEPSTVVSALRFLNVSTKYLTNDITLVSELQDLMSHDYDTYSHSASVYIYSISLAEWMGIHDEGILRDIGIGALLHDIGKTKIDPAILRKPAPLDKNEWAEMQQHPGLGESMAANIPTISDNARRLILEHHERCDGSGYPYGLTKNRIHWLTHMTMVADVYDALTKDRPYRQAYAPFQALSIMKVQCSCAIDIGVYKALVLMLAGGASSRKDSQ